MKLVKEYNDRVHADNFAEKLKSNGIASVVYMSKGNNTNIYGGGPKLWGVAVLLEDQFSCAQKLTKGNRHKVSKPLSQEEIYEVEKNFIQKDISSFKLHLRIGLIILTLISLLMIWVA